MAGPQNEKGVEQEPHSSAINKPNCTHKNINAASFERNLSNNPVVAPRLLAGCGTENRSVCRRGQARGRFRKIRSTPPASTSLIGVCLTPAQLPGSYVSGRAGTAVPPYEQRCGVGADLR